ncbi:MAG: hypothetical protein M1825_001939 [Sarcosagium campestre]|nr:MAG: hypothetical protein M1825_001939 [Sarcosagium campestre]
MFCHLKNVVFLLSLGASLQSFSCSALPQQRNSSGYAALETRDAKDPTPRIITYHQTIYSKGDSQYVPILPLVGTGVTHINIGAIHLNENEGDIRLNDHAPWHERFVPLRRDIGEVQKSGIKVFAFLGGAARGTYWRLSRPGEFEKYYEPLRDMLATWNFDGLDLDIEEPVSLQSVIRLIDRVKQDFGPDFLITAAPVAPALLTGGYNLAGFNFFDLEKERGDDIAWYNAQFYCGHAQASDTTDYERIISHGWDPAKVVMGVCANPQLAQGSSVFDLPQIHARPPAPALLEALSLAELDTPSWDLSDNLTTAKPRIDPDGLARYLTGIVASKLSWIPDESDREKIWEQASLRLSERSGRTAMPPVSRSFHIKTNLGTTIEIKLHEPSLTSDNLGLKTWASSFLLAQRLHLLAQHPPFSSRPRTLELGAGTGLVGISAAAIWGAHVYLTDLPTIVDNLAANVQANDAVLTSSTTPPSPPASTRRTSGRGGATTGVLDWADTANAEDRRFHRFTVILAADPLYAPEHPQMLVDTIIRWLAREEMARVLMEWPLREAYASEGAHCRVLMEEAGLALLEQGEEIGYDDWSEASWRGGGLEEIKCWWGMWGWKSSVEEVTAMDRGD